MLWEPVSFQQKVRRGLIEWFQERRGEKSVGLRIVEEAQRESVKVYDLRVNAEVGSVCSFGIWLTAWTKGLSWMIVGEF